MNKRWFSVSALIMAWMFAFSTLSTCYCQPLSASAPTAQPAAHCGQHSSKAKGCCSPRIQNDTFENAASQVHVEQKSVRQFLAVHDTQTDLSVLSERNSFRPALDTSPPPQLYLLHHAFLI